MKVTINGEQHELATNSSIATVLADFALARESVVIEHNRTLLSATDDIETPLNDGDTLELVRFVGGG